MECMEARALKSSFSSELTMKTGNPQGIIDDYWCLTALPSEDFSIDEFFNLPNDESNSNNIIINNSSSNSNHNKYEEEEEDDDEEEEKDSNSPHSPSSHGLVDDSLLSIPDDDMHELELWSHLMDDSIPEPNLACPKAIMDAHRKKDGFTFVNRIEPGTINQRFVRASFFPTVVPVKPRSKRSRATLNRSWFTGSPKTESSSSSSSLSPSSPVSTLLFAPPVHDMGLWFTHCKPPLKKPKKHKPAQMVNGETGFNYPVQRRCSHCQVTKTPQWRAGPNGPKTLCNACGVRFKSGRLFPEYRPACSPTFSSEVHSNSHRKVLEMRRKKEMGEPEAGSAHPVSSS